MEIDRPHTTQKIVRINWEGSLFVHHSLGMVNRELLAELTRFSDLAIRHIPYEPDQFSAGTISRYASVAALEKEPHPDAHIHIRHRWPPDFSRPASGKFILMQPWEYGSLPVSWVNEIGRTVDEVWVYTDFLKTCYERSGIPQEKIHVTPLGIDPLLFRPEAPAMSTEERGGCFRFLYNGGLITRKGADILVNAYLNEFKCHEPVCLVIKDSVAVYPQGMTEKVRALASRGDTARIVYHDAPLSQEELPGLYTSCDCYVHPYRAEGYGLSIAEAMACGLPVIVPNGGACLDFVDRECGYFIDCKVETMNVRQVGDYVTVGNPFWLKPDMGHLQSLMRLVFEQRNEAKERGSEGARKIRTTHNWGRAAQTVYERILALTQ